MSLRSDPLQAKFQERCQIVAAAGRGLLERDAIRSATSCFFSSMLCSVERTAQNRISIGRLTRIAEALDVPPTFFFAIETKAALASANKSRELLAADGAPRLIKAFDRFRSRQMRTSFVQIAERIAKTEK